MRLVARESAGLRDKVSTLEGTVVKGALPALTPPADPDAPPAAAAAAGFPLAKQVGLLVTGAALYMTGLVTARFFL